MATLTARRKRMRAALIEVAVNRSTISYSEFGAKFGVTEEMDFHFLGLSDDVGAISEFENEFGRPLLSCLVVHADDERMPGAGFFRFAHSLGKMKRTPKDVLNRLEFQISELRAVHDYWCDRLKSGFKIKIKSTKKKK